MSCPYIHSDLVLGTTCLSTIGVRLDPKYNGFHITALRMTDIHIHVIQPKEQLKIGGWLEMDIILCLSSTTNKLKTIESGPVL